MKKKCSYILSGLAVIPIVSVLVINSLANRTDYYIANEKGNKKEMSSVKFESIQDEYSARSTKVIFSADGVNKEKYSDFYLYGDYEGIKSNKDLFRGKRVDSNFAAQDEKYACYASVEQHNSNYYIDLYIKDLKSGEIKNNRFDLKFNSDKGYFNTTLVKISDGYVNVVLQKALNNNESSEETETLINYKFDLSTGKFLKDFELGKKLNIIKDNSSNENIYVQHYSTKEKEDEAFDSTCIEYNVTTDTVKEIKMPDGFDINAVVENNGSQYIFSYQGEMIERTADGKLKEKVKLVDKVESEVGLIGAYKVKDNKVYAVFSRYDSHGQKCLQEAIKVYSLDTGKELYSGDIMKKSTFDSKGQAAGGCRVNFI